MKNNYGYPAGIKAVYDSPEMGDRYTIVFSDNSYYRGKDRLYNCVGSSDHPTHPQGFYQHSACMIGSHLGQKISWRKLPEIVRKLVKQEI